MLSTAREVARALGGHRVVGYLASACALLALVSLARHELPLTTLARGADWLGVDITVPLANADAWINAPSRHDVLVLLLVGIVGVALLAQARRQAAVHSELTAAFRSERPLEVAREFHRWTAACETQFWSIAWIAAAALLQLGATSDAMLAGLAVVLAMRLIGDLVDAKSSAAHFHSRMRDHFLFYVVMSVGASLIWAAMTAGGILLRLSGILTRPALPPDRPSAPA